MELVFLAEVGLSPLDASSLPVVRLALLFAAVAVALGVSIAGAITRRQRLGDPAPCRLHEWLQEHNGRFICLRCSQWAGSPPPSMPLS